MLNSILIGKYIYKFLANDETVAKLSNHNIGPLVANEETKYPFIVFSRTSLIPSYDKDGTSDDSVEEQIICVSNDYTQVCELANAVRNCIDKKSYKSEEINIEKIRLQNVTESYLDDAYLQILTFDIQIN